MKNFLIITGIVGSLVIVVALGANYFENQESQNPQDSNFVTEAPTHLQPGDDHPEINRFDYINRQHNISLKNNGQWVKDEFFDAEFGQLVRIVSPADDRQGNDTFYENVSLVLTPLPSDIGLEEFWQEFENIRSQQLANYTNQEKKSILVDNVEAIQTTYSFTSPQSPESIIVVQQMFVRDGKGYALSYTAEESSFEKHKEAAFIILNSVKLF